MVRQVFALGVLFVIAGACGGQSTLSEGDGEPAAGETGNGGATNGGSSNGGVSGGGSSSGGTSGGGTDPCAGKQCGDPCSTCSPNGGCILIQQYCDANGVCGGGSRCPLECTSMADCPETDPVCSPCPDGSLACAGIDCVDGRCTPVAPPACPECGDDSHCRQPPPDCVTCDYGTVSCPIAECLAGKCERRWSGNCIAVDPCAGHHCGEPCHACAAPPCPPTEPPSVCNFERKCVAEAPACFGRCMTRDDCPAPPPDCGDCPMGTCRTVDCIDGVCEHLCR